MNENINLVEILKDCPKGTKLYSTVLGEVEFEGVTDSVNYPVRVKLNEEQFGERIIETFTSDGRLIATYKGECVLFPSREERDWSKFKPKKDWFVPPCKFKDGDILSYQCGTSQNRTIYIYRQPERFNTGYYVAISGDPDEEFMIDNKGVFALNGYNDTARFATEEEKQKLFDAIKLYGYKWNAETKTLEKLVKPKFDPKTLKAFDKVLVRLTKNCIWNATFFSHYDKEVNWGCYPCVTTSCKSYDKCIPYNEETKHLIGTTEEAPEYYRYWED